MICPNKNLPEWKALEEKHPDLALYYWSRYEGNIPKFLLDDSIVEDIFDNNPELANQAYESLGFGVDFLTGKLKLPSFNTQKEYYLAKDVKSLLSDIVKFTEDSDTKLLAETLLQIPRIEKINLNVSKYNKETKDRGVIKDTLNVLGTYSSFQNLIKIIGTLDKKTFETVFLHELIHGVTVNEYKTNKEFSGKIDKLYTYALKFKNYQTSSGVLLGDMYGMENPKEFMSEAMTNPDFIFELSKYYSPTEEVLRKKNIFQQFIELIVDTIKQKIESKGKKYIENNLGTTVLNVVSNYSKINLNKVRDVSKSVLISPPQRQQAIQKYQEYLSTIFPDSKVGDIVYHGTETASFDEQFIKDEAGYFIFTTTNYDYAKVYTNNVGKVWGALNNFKNPLNVKELLTNKNSELSEKFKNFLAENGYRGYELSTYLTASPTSKTALVPLTNRPFLREFYEKEGYDALYGWGETAVFEPEQIHILGSKQDIEGFKNFVSSNVSETKGMADLDIESCEK